MFSGMIQWGAIGFWFGQGEAAAPGKGSKLFGAAESFFLFTPAQKRAQCRRTFPSPLTMKKIPASSASDTKLIVRGLHMELTDAIRAFVESKCEKLFRHHERIIRIRVDVEYDKLRKGKPRFIAKGHIEISGPDMVISAEDADAYKAIDQMAQKLDRQLRIRASALKKKKTRPHAVELDADLPKVG